MSFERAVLHAEKLVNAWPEDIVIIQAQWRVDDVDTDRQCSIVQLSRVKSKTLL